ncbi:MAG: hypothetical protein IJZ73_05960 [Clostridia bacterium]|nr:hypothetical protein [Clostridia bacterium]
MTKKTFTKKIGYLLTLALICIMSFVMVFTTACSKPDGTAEAPKYTYTDVDKGEIVNANFSYGQANTDLSKFPASSPTGWSLSRDNSATSSTIASGVIDVTADGWAELCKTFYKDNDFKSYLRRIHSSYTDSIVEGVLSQNGINKGDENYDEKFYEYVKENYIDTTFANPGKSPALSKDSNVYMINNYLNGDLDYGTAQKISSSSTVTIEKGKVAKITVWVKTANLKSYNPDGNFGANIRVTNTINGQQQADFKISNIKDTEWTKYTLYVTADEEYDTTISLTLGLGYGVAGSNYSKTTEGTAYFDGITYEVLDSVESGVTLDYVNNFSYNAESETEYKVTTINSDPNVTEGAIVKYDMNFKNSYDSSYFTEKTFATAPTGVNQENDNYFFTKSNITDGNGQLTGKLDESSVTATINSADATAFPYASKVLNLDVTKAGYTVLLKDGSSNFVVDATAGNEYTYISFYVKLDAAAFCSSDLTVLFHDVLVDPINSNNTIDKKRDVGITITEAEDWQRVSLLVKNNFTDSTAANRQFYLELVVGPTSISTLTNPYEYASGNIQITAPVIKQGAIPESTEDGYGLYSFFNLGVYSTVSLYSGYTHENAYEEDKATTYAINPSNAQVGEILFAPTDIDAYKGIEADHVYVNKEGTKSAINTRSGKDGDGNGNYAGLINTKYINNYTIGTDIATALNHSGDDIQPIMIYNSTADNYGFVGTKYSVAKSANAKVSVTLKVSGANAFAKVYLVDLSDISVMKFADFTVNTSEGLQTGTNAKGTAVDGSALTYELKVTEDMCNATDDGWVNLEFYLGTGAEEKDFRVEIWNGDRAGSEKSTGFVFVKSISISTTSAFTEQARWADAFTLETAPLYNKDFTGANDTLYAYQRELTDSERAFNKDYPDQAISYDANYVWAKNENTVYGLFGSINPIVSDPYSTIVEDDKESAGCTQSTDPSTFWLSFSSILLGACLIAAIVALIVKNILRKHRRNKTDAKSHYKVTSRIKTDKENKKKAEKIAKKLAKVEEEVQDDEPYTATVENTAEEVVNDETEEVVDEQLDSYVYGDVQDFGNDEEK